MMNLQDIINLCKNEQGKVFIMDEQGDVTLVILGIDTYKSMQRGGKPVIKVRDPEIVSRKIIKAQLEEDSQPVPPPVVPIVSTQPVSRMPRPVDMREEVIDPSFNFDSPDDL